MKFYKLNTRLKKKRRRRRRRRRNTKIMKKKPWHCEFSYGNQVLL
jgi:hypothetical protein